MTVSGAGLTATESSENDADVPLVARSTPALTYVGVADVNAPLVAKPSTPEVKACPGPDPPSVTVAMYDRVAGSTLMTKW